MKIRQSIVFSGLSLATGLAISGSALADHYDQRFGHDHYYPDRGFTAHELPRDRMPIVHGPDHYFYSRGVWYAPRGGIYVVITPPVGVFIPALPPYYSTVWFGGIPYYYANDTYYLWNAQQDQYEVVAPPPDAVAAPADAAPPPTPQPAAQQMFVYPKNGQSQEQQAKDQYECHAWAVSQTGFDPTASGGNVPADQFGSKSADYSRALGACLTGRGYSVQ